MKRVRRGSQKGVAAVELAILLPVLISLLTIPLYFGLYYYHHTVVNKAACGAARYMSTVSKTTMRSPTQVRKATDMASRLAMEMLGEVGGEDLSVQVDCDQDDCLGGSALPQYVEVFVTLRLRDPFGWMDTGDFGFRVSGRSTFRYQGQ